MILDPSNTTLGRDASDNNQTAWQMTDATTVLSVSQHKFIPVINHADHQCPVVLKELSTDHPDSFITLETALLTMKIVCGALMPLLAFSGLFLNVVNMLVFWNQGLRQRINFLLFCLACADFVLLIHLTMISVDIFFTLFKGPFHTIGPVQETMANKHISFLYGFVYESGFISTMIALERYICISHPFIAKTILKTKVAGIIMIVSTTVLVGIHSIAFSKYRVRCVYYLEEGITLKSYFPSQFYLDNRFLVDVLNGVVYGLALPIFFFLTTTVTTVITAVKLRRAATWRRGQTSAAEADSKEVAVTKMLIAVSCVFIVCSVPNILIKVTPFFLPGFTIGGKNQNLFLLGVSLSHFFPAINSSINFFFYFKMGSRFRVELKTLFCPASWKTKESTESQETNTSAVSSFNHFDI